jgi:magnesium transporter
MSVYELIAGGGRRQRGIRLPVIETPAGGLRRRRGKNPQQVPPEALLAIRSDVARLALLWHEQIHGLRELKRCHAFIPATDGAHGQLHDLISDGVRGLELLSQMENRLRDLRQHQQQSLQESTNRRLNMLAILSEIYMPATLIAGIYGMNLKHIPITAVPHGYYMVMAFMAVIVAGHFWYFYRRGWFK